MNLEVQRPRNLSGKDVSVLVKMGSKSKESLFEIPESVQRKLESTGPQETERDELALTALERSHDNIIQLRPLSPENKAFVEQNFGCELPVCVSNRRARKNDKIEFTTEKGAHFRITRDACGLLPGPEHYKYWIWFLAMTSKAALKFTDKPLRAVPAPWIPIDPVEIGDAIGATRSKTSNSYAGSLYDSIDDAFGSFAGLRITTRNAFWDAERKKHIMLEGQDPLISYRSWREERDDDDGFGFTKGAAKPSQPLWDSIRSGYGLTVGQLKEASSLSYIALRLKTWLTKHARFQPNEGWFVKSLLPKIPLQTPPQHVKMRLKPAHDELMAIGFLKAEPTYLGRGTKLRVHYQLTDPNPDDDDLLALREADLRQP